MFDSISTKVVGKWIHIFIIFASLVSSIVLIFGAISSLLPDKVSDEVSDKASDKVIRPPFRHVPAPVITDERVLSDISSIRTELLSVKSQLDKVRVLSKETASALKIEELDSTVSDLLSQVSKLSRAIVEDPEEAVSSTLLRKELDLMRSEHKSSISMLTQQIEHVSGLGKWFVGALISMVVCMLGLVIGIIIQTRSSSG